MDTILKTVDLTKKYDGRTVVDNLNIEIKKGEIFGLLGPNGAGKSTTMNMICNIVKPDYGTAEFMGKDFRKNKKELSKRLGYIPQNLAIHGSLKAWENVELFTSLYGIKGEELKDRIDEALDKYAELTELTPAISEEKFKLYIGMGETKKAFRQLDELIASYPDDYNYVLYKAEMYCVLRDTLSADKTFEKAFRKDGDDPSLQYIFARYLDGVKRDTVQALDYYYKTILNPKSTFNLQSSALLSASLDSTQALNDTVYDKFIAQYPDEYLSYFCKAIYLYAKNDTSCYNYFKKSLSINPSQESTWMTILTYYSESQNLDSTISVCQAALEHFPSNVDFNYMLGYAKYAKKEYPAAVNSLRKAAKLAQKNKNILLSSRLYGSLGDCYHEMGEKENAFAAYDTAVVLDESNMMALNNYAYYLSVENRDLKKAERLSGITVNKDPKNATFLDTYAWVYFKLGEYGMANLYIEQAYNYGGKENAEVVEHYGDILYKMGEPQEAYLTKWKEALKLKEANGAVDESNNLRKKVETGVYVE